MYIIYLYNVHITLRRGIVLTVRTKYVRRGSVAKIKLHISNYDLIKMLDPYASIWVDDGRTEEDMRQNKEAKKFLIGFCGVLERLPLDRGYKSGMFHTKYLFYVLRIRDALEKQKYITVCSELQNLIHFQPITQPRICYNILNLLKSYLDLTVECEEND